MKKAYNLIILDASGSMQSIREATISGFNELIQGIAPKRSRTLNCSSLSSSSASTPTASAN